ncbi:MAG: hypothetical protein FJY99_08085 [Candidatus Sericytochromatia bacterium]|nr:hypothetical protein [Candidatus Tanganyikabacteria bacterium]
MRADRLDGRAVLLATADLPAGEVLYLEWERDGVVSLVDGAWTGKCWVFAGPPAEGESSPFRIRARAGSALRRVTGPLGGHLLARGLWQSGSEPR